MPIAGNEVRNVKNSVANSRGTARFSLTLFIDSEGFAKPTLTAARRRATIKIHRPRKLASPRFRSGGFLFAPLYGQKPSTAFPADYLRLEPAFRASRSARMIKIPATVIVAGTTRIIASGGKTETTNGTRRMDWKKKRTSSPALGAFPAPPAPSAATKRPTTKFGINRPGIPRPTNQCPRVLFFSCIACLRVPTDIVWLGSAGIKPAAR